MSIATGSAPSNFPQTTDNPTLSERTSELVEYVGGTVREDHKRKARDCYRRANRRLNRMPWSFRRASKDFDIAGDKVAGTTNEYAHTDKLFRDPLRSQLVDSDDNTREWVEYVDWTLWTKNLPDQTSTAASPIIYTTRNIHSDGRIILDPPPATNLTWPTFRLFYHQRVPLLTADTDRLAAPMEVEEMCFMWAVYYFVGKVRTLRDARELGADARDYEIDIVDEWRDWEDY